MQLNFDTLLAEMWDYMGLTRVYTKRRGEVLDAQRPCFSCMLNLFISFVVRNPTLMAQSCYRRSAKV